MLRNYFTVAYRNFIKGKLYSFINVTGLAIGVTCSMLIFLYISDELSFDRYHSKADRIYRINEFYEANDGSGERSASIPFPVVEAMELDYPEIIESSVRLFNFQAPTLTVAYEAREKEFNERNFFFADSTYHNVFDLALIKGDPKTALNNPNSVVISEHAARKYFNDEEPMGKLLRFQDRTDLMVTGVMKDMPMNSHFRADFLGSFSTLRDFFGGQYPQGWFWNPCWTYVLLRQHADPQILNARFPEFVDKRFPANIKEDISLKVQPLKDIHLRSHLDFEIGPNGNEANIYLFSGVAVFVLLIACINFMNLSTARSINRAKEVGMRKTIGCRKHQLVTQFMIESVLMSFLAVIFSVLLVYLSLPWFNIFADKQINLNLTDPILFLGLGLAGIGVGVISGIYPALVLTSFNPITALKAKYSQNSGFSFRQVLVVAQFAISIILIIGTGVAIRQLDFLQNDEVGFQRDHIVMVPVIRTPMARQFTTFVDQGLTFKDIRSVTALEEVLGAKYQTANYQFEGMERESLYSRLNVRHDFLKTFNIPLLAGRDYSRDVPTDDSLALVVNETLVRGLGWTPEQAIGRRFHFGRFQGQIIGVAKDFNFSSKHAPIGPLVMHLNTNPGAFNLFLKYMAVRINPENPKESIKVIEKLWNDLVPSKPFEYFFLDDELNNLYKAEANLSKVAGTFSMLAIFVACLGLFGLASYNAEQRKKEIGIRKVLGSSVQQILALMFSNYARLLVIAILIACPIAYIALDHWLSGFAYRIDIPLLTFVFASVATLLIALVTVSYKSFSVARSNPVDSLREE
jgi:putative ABC transport system permease protein